MVVHLSSGSSHGHKQGLPLCGFQHETGGRAYSYAVPGVGISSE